MRDRDWIRAWADRRVHHRQAYQAITMCAATVLAILALLSL
jgi:hypothetical protein